VTRAIAVAGAALAAAAIGVRAPFWVFALGASGLGAAYGGFLLELRDYVSRAVRDEGKRALLTWFNNMANVSALIAFGLMMTLAAVRANAPGGPYFWTLCLIAALPLAGGALLLLAAAALGGRATDVQAGEAGG
jgi:hypothetical protein